MHVGDIVKRKSYVNDINFMIQDIKGNRATLVGLDFRLVAYAQLSDLEKIAMRSAFRMKEHIKKGILFNPYYYEKDKEEIEKEAVQMFSRGICYGRVLHIDANSFYLEQSLRQYMRLGVPVVGISISESSQPNMIKELLEKNQPNILVITGHDAIIKDCTRCNDAAYYLNSQYFVESIKVARTYNRDYDELVIIAGGCKSYYEALMQAGANFASSPNRVLLNVTDPVYIACKIAMTSIREIVDMESITREFSINTGKIGGIETRGQSRNVIPRF